MDANANGKKTRRLFATIVFKIAGRTSTAFAADYPYQTLHKFRSRPSLLVTAFVTCPLL